MLTIYHEPFGWYRQRKEEFFLDRAAAYRRIAHSLPSHIRTIRSESVWIDYAREAWVIEEKQNTPIQRLTAVWFYWMNVENWNRDPGSSWYAIGNTTYRVATMTREQYVVQFLIGVRGEGDGNFTSGHGLGGFD